MRYCLALVGSLTILAASPVLGELVVRVENRAGAPRLVVNGKVTPPRMFWGRSNGARTPLSEAWTHFTWKLTPHAPIAKGVFIFRTEESAAAFDVSNLTVRAEADVGTACSPMSVAGRGSVLTSAPVALAAEKTYLVSFDVRGEGARWFRCGLEQRDAGVYYYHAQEVPWDDGERTSLVNESRQALAAGCEFVTFFTANCWRDGFDDWGAYDAQMRQLIAIDPKIRLIPRVTVNAPAWWLKKHPECAMVYEGGVTGNYASVSSRLYRKEANAYLGRLVRHLMTTYPENFAGIHFTGQNSAEWFYKDSARRFFGYDVCTRDAFRRYLAGIGDPDAATAEVPTVEARNLMKDAPQRFIDLKTRKRLLDFQRFLQIEMVDTVGELAATCRAASEGKKLVMAFYGYHWELASYALTPGNTGHYGVMRLIEKWGKNLDSLSGPVSYAGRDPIGFAGVMSPAETLHRHGIFWFDEDDLRVHAVDNRKAQKVFGLTENLAEDRQVMTRTVGMEVARGLGGWWMDLFGGGWYSDAGTWDVARELQAFERRMLARPVRTPEVAALSDEASILHLERMRGGNVPSSGCLQAARTSLAKAGVSFGQYVLEDALAKPLDAKVEFHLSTWKPLDVAALVRQVRARPDVTRVWCWAPPAEATGFSLRPIAGTTAKVTATAAGLAAGLDAEWAVSPAKPIDPLYAAADAAADEVWATWPDGSAAIAVRRNPGGRGYSVFCGIPWLTPRLVAAACRLGEVHEYLPPERVGKAVLWAGNGFLTVQSHERATFEVNTGFAGGVRDAMSGEILSQGPRATVSFEAGDARILEDAAQDLVLATRGQTADRAIVIRAEASASERYAAEEFRDFTEKVTGVRLPIVTDAEPLPAKAILLGETRHTAAVLGGCADISKLGEDGFHLKAVSPHLLVMGSPVRGVLYGVYELLEKYAGCRWYASWCTVTPSRDAFRIPGNLDDVQTPAFSCREPHWWDMFKSDFAARSRANGPSNRPQPRHGGNTWRFGGGLGNCHTMQRLVSASVYGKDHPEYFALHGGVRRNDAHSNEDFAVQPCLTNPDVLKIVISNVLARIRRDPSARFYGVSQNDNQLYCECPRCAAVDAEEGSHAGTVVRFVNAIADAVAAEFPDKYIETLAYNYSRVPPKKTRLRPNVIPCFCSIECEFSKPLTESTCPENRQLLRDILGWESQTDQLYVWDYVTDFAHYPHLFPNVYALQDNIRFFRDHHVKTLFEQGACQGRHAGFAELKAWLIAKWMWNPELPVKPLLDDFFAGYYGAGAPYVREVFEKAHALQLAAAARGEYLKIYQGVNRSPLDDAFLDEAAALMAKAEAATKDDAVRNYNVRMTAFGVDYMRIERMRRGRLKLVDFSDGADVRKVWAKLQSLVKLQLTRMDEAKDIRLSSGAVTGAHTTTLNAWKKIAGDTADGAEFVAARKGLVQDGILSTLKPGLWTNRVKDPKALDGSAIEITNVHYGWCVTFFLDQVAFKPGRKYRLAARLRVAKAADAVPNDQAFSLGVYDNELKKGRIGTSRRIGQVKTDDYAWYDLGEWTPGETADMQYFWAATGHFDKTKRACSAATVYLDAIRFSEVDESNSKQETTKENK